MHEIPRLRLGGHLADLDVRMAQQQPQQLAAAVAGAADDGDADGRRHCRASAGSVRRDACTRIRCVSAYIAVSPRVLRCPPCRHSIGHLRHLQRVLRHPRRDVHPGRGDAVAELHRVVDLVDQQAALGVLEEVERQHAAAHGARGLLAQPVDLRRDRAVARRAAAGRVGDPMIGPPVDRGDGLVADHEGPDVAARLVDVFLDVEDAVLVGAERLLVLQDRLGRVAVVDPRQQPAPGADDRLQHGRIAELFDGRQRGLGGEGQPGAGLRHARLGQRRGGQQLVGAGGGGGVAVDRRDAGHFQRTEDVQSRGRR